MKDSPLYPVVFMVALAALFGAVVSSVAVATRGLVEAGEKARFRSHVLGAFGIDAPEDPEALQSLWERTVEAEEGPAGTVYRARGEDGRLLGYGFPFQAPGFWGPIRGVLAVDPAGRRILGLSFTSHQETPGLGGRITEPWFRNQFRGKLLAPAAGGGDPLHFVTGEPRGPREVEAITGATQTSTRLGRFLNDFLPKLPERPVFRGGSSG